MREKKQDKVPFFGPFVTAVNWIIARGEILRKDENQFVMNAIIDLFRGLKLK